MSSEDVIRTIDVRTPEMKARDEFVLGLHQVAQFYSDNPNMPLPAPYYRRFDVEVPNKESLNDAVMAMRPCKKRDRGFDFIWTRKFGGITVTMSIYKSKVCERVKTGKQILIPATPASPGEPERYEDETVWKCDQIPENGDDDAAPIDEKLASDLNEIAAGDHPAG